MLSKRMEASWFPRCEVLTSRYGDLDADKMLSELAVARYVEQARSHMLTEVYQAEGYDIREGEVGLLLARSSVNYFSHRVPSLEVKLASGVSRIGRTSANLLVGIYCEDTCIALSENVMVFILRSTGRPVPVPQPLVQRMQPLLCQPPAQAE